jgi:CheY-like chemotaxis protein
MALLYVVAVSIFTFFGTVLVADSSETSLSFGTGAGVGLLAGGVAGIIGAISQGFFQPWLRERKTEERRAALEAEKLELARAKLDADEENRKLIASLTSLTQSHTQLTEKHTRITQLLLVKLGKVSSWPVEHDPLLIADGPAPKDGPSVLLVEDDPIAREAMVTMLELVHCRVTAVATLMEGFEKLESDPPEVLILDLMLPGGDGIELLRRVRDRRLDTRVIVTTGKDRGQLAEVRAMKPFAIIRKPINFMDKLVPALKGEPIEDDA